MTAPARGVDDTAGYRRLCEPHESREALLDAVDQFSAAVRELSEQYRIPDVVVVMRANATTPDGEQQMITTHHHGDSTRTESMLAWALGRERRERDRMISLLAAELAPR